jgi:hypothetical protein
MSKASQKPGESTPDNFTGKPVAARKAPKAFGRSGTADNQSTDRGKGKT